MVMNDFTKQELEFLLDRLDFFGVDYLGEHFEILEKEEFEKQRTFLEEKVRSMIDNYCEHKNTYSGSGTFYYCDDCEKVFI